MKRIVFLLGIFMLGGFSYAQTTGEAYQLAKTQSLGTARYNAMSGAFGALGGDFTAMGENPAASAVFNHSSGAITLGVSSMDYTTDYLNTTTTTNDSNFDLTQAGAVLVLNNTSANAGITKFTLGITFNVEADYRDNYNFRGNATNTIGDYFVSQANNSGIPFEDVGVNDGERLDDRYIVIGDQYGFSGQQALLGFQAGAININEDFYESAVTGNTIQDIEFLNRGSQSKTSLNFGTELDKTFYFGANLNLHNYDYRKTQLYTETNANSDITSILYDTEVTTFGNGVSLGLGAIAKLGNQIRVGASYNTPTYALLIDELSQQVTTFDVDNNRFNADPNIIYQFPEYRLTTPGIMTGSIALVFGKNGLLSAQYSRQDFSKTRYDFGNSALNEQESSAVNSDIENTFTAVNTLKIGGELRSERWSFRGGFSHASSPYQNTSVQGDTRGFSLGTGYDWGKWKLDFAYNRVETDFNETLFENPGFTNSAAVNRTDGNFTTTLSINF